MKHETINGDIVLRHIPETDKEAMTSGGIPVRSVIAYDPYPDRDWSHLRQTNMTGRNTEITEVSPLNVFKAYLSYFPIGEAFEKMVEIDLINNK